MIYITGDTHRDFSRLNNLQLNKNDLIIILGDAGINFCLNNRDEALKEQLNSLNVKFVCIRGNHEERPENIKSYIEMNIFAGTVYLEENYPNLLFAKDGETYNIAGQSVLTIGGAYSIDKYYRLYFGKRSGIPGKVGGL